MRYRHAWCGWTSPGITRPRPCCGAETRIWPARTQSASASGWERIAGFAWSTCGCSRCSTDGTARPRRRWRACVRPGPWRGRPARRGRGGGGGQARGARARLCEAGGLGEEIGLPGELWQIWAALGELHEQRGEREEAYGAFSRAARIVETLAGGSEDQGLEEGL